MSKGNWRTGYTVGLAAGALLAAGVAGWLGISTEQLQSEIEHTAAEQAADYGNAAYIPVEGRCSEIEGAQPPCISPEQEAAREAQRNERDLEAQQKMAIWTRAMGIAAIIGMAVGIFGVGLIFVTFRETRRAADEARRAADQAEQTRKSYIERERGHLTIKAVEGWMEDDRIKVGFSVGNIGASLAEIYGISVDLLSQPIWPESIDGVTTELQVKVGEGGGGNYVSVSLSKPEFPCYGVGFIQYKTLGADDCRVHFICEIKWIGTELGNPIVVRLLRDVFLPNNT